MSETTPKDNAPDQGAKKPSDDADLAAPENTADGVDMDMPSHLSRMVLWSRHSPVALKGKAIAKAVGYRLFRLFGELSAIVLGIGFFWLCAVNVVVAQKEIDVGFLEPNVARWFSTAFDGKSADIGTMTVSWRAQDNAVIFEATDIAVKGDDGLSIQGIDALSSEFALNDVVRARFTPLRIKIDGGQLTWLRRADGEIVAGLGTPETVGRLGPVWRADGDTAADRPDIGAFERLSVSRAKIYLKDEKDELNLVFTGANLNADFTPDAIVFDIDALISEGGQDDAAWEPDAAASIAASGNFRTDLTDVDVTIKTEQFNPARYLPRQGTISAGRNLDAPLSLTTRVTATAQDGLTVLDIDASAGRGTLSFAGRQDRFTDAKLTSRYDVAANELNVSALEIKSEPLSLSGELVLGNIGSPAQGFFKNTATFDVALNTLRIDMRPRFVAPLSMRDVSAKGRWNQADRVLDIDKLAADFGAYQLGGDVAVDLTAANTPEAIAANVKFAGVVTKDDLLSLWPANYILGARQWISNSILQGDITNLSIKLDADANALAQPALPNEALDMTFDLANGAVRYIRTMTPATEAIGKGRVEGNRATFMLERGRVGDIALSNGIVEIPRIYPYGGLMTISADGAGAVTDLLALIDQKPFEYVSKYGVDANSFTGDGQIRLTLSRPLRQRIKYSDITYRVTGTMNNVSAPFSIGEYRMTNGNVSLMVDTDGLSVKGPVEIGGWDADLAWSETFDNGATPTRYSIAGPVGRDDLDGFGLGFREFLSGTMMLEIDAIADGLEISSAKVSVDLKDADMRLGPYWSKDVGTAGQMTGDMSLTKADGLSLDNIMIMSPGLEVTGAIDLGRDFRLINLNLDKAKIAGFIDAAVQVRPTEAKDRFDMLLTGDYLDVSPFVSSLMQPSSGGGIDVPILVTAALRRLALNEAYVVRDANVLFAHNGEGLTQARLKGNTIDGDLIANLTTDDTELARRLRIDIPNASDAVFALFGIESLLGGRMQIDAEMPLVGMVGPVVGEAVIDDVKIVQAPIMTRILSLASLQGLADALGGEGLSFQELDVPFSLDGQVLSVRGARAAGPALGMTAEGEIDFGGKTLDVDGVLVPAYTANSLLGSIPLLGDIVVGKRGEGIFALSYTVRGPFEQSQVAVNPLSALTPGFLRGIFRPQREALPKQVLDAIEDVAPKRDAAEPEEKP